MFEVINFEAILSFLPILLEQVWEEKRGSILPINMEHPRMMSTIGLAKGKV